MTIGMVQAQIFFTEDFEGTMDPTTNIPTGWTETGLSTDGIWSTGDATAASSAYITVPAPPQGTNFAYTSDDDCNCDKSADRMIMPAQNFTGMVGVNLIFDVWLPGTYGGLGSVEVSTDGGATWVSVSTITQNPNWQDNVSVSLNAYAGNASVLVSFLYDDAGNWADAMGVDDVRLEQLTSSAPDIATSAVTGSGEYTQTPLSQATTFNLSADVVNSGTADATDATLTVNVYDAANLATPLQTTSSPATPIVASATATLSAGTFMPMSAATYVIEYITTATGDLNTSNDTTVVVSTISDDVYARDDNNNTGSLGIGAGGAANGILGQNFAFSSTETIDSVQLYITNGGNGNTMVGQPLSVKLYSTTAGEPTTLLATSDTITITTTGPQWVSIAFPGGFTLPSAGDYFFGAVESDSNITLGTTQSIFTAGAGWVDWTGNPAASAPWSNSEEFGFQVAYMLRLKLACSGASLTTQVDSSVLCNGGSGVVSVSATGGAGTYTYLWSNGSTASTASGSAGTYTVTVTDAASCPSVETIVLTEPDSFSVAVDSFANVSCNGGSDGLVAITLSGGTAPYSYNWSNGATTDDLFGLIAGTYFGTVTDANGCSFVAPVPISEPAVLVSSAVDNGNGTATASATGGTSPYTYLWSDGQSTATASGLSSGSYDVTVTDANGCTDVTSVSVVVTGVDNIAALTQLDVFPTPADDVLHINLSLQQSDDVSFRIVNVAGVEVMNRNLGATLGDRIELNITELPAGVYTIYFTVGDEMTNRRLIVSRK